MATVAIHELVIKMLGKKDLQYSYYIQLCEEYSLLHLYHDRMRPLTFLPHPSHTTPVITHVWRDWQTNLWPHTSWNATEMLSWKQIKNRIVIIKLYSWPIRFQCLEPYHGVYKRGTPVNKRVSLKLTNQISMPRGTPVNKRLNLKLTSQISMSRGTPVNKRLNLKLTNQISMPRGVPVNKRMTSM